MLESAFGEKIIIVTVSFTAFYAVLRLILWYFDNGVVNNIRQAVRPVIQQNSDGEIRVSFGKTNKNDDITNQVEEQQQDLENEIQKNIKKDYVEKDYVQRINDKSLSEDKDLESKRVIGVKAEIKGKWTKKVFDRFMNEVESKGLDLENSQGIFTAKEQKKEGIVSGVNNARGGGGRGMG